MTVERKEGKLLCQMLKDVLGEKVEDNQLLTLEHVLDYLRPDPPETHLDIPYVSSYLCAYTYSQIVIINASRFPLLPFSPIETDNVVQALHSNLNCPLWPRYETALLKRLVEFVFEVNIQLSYLPLKRSYTNKKYS